MKTPKPVEKIVEIIHPEMGTRVYRCADAYMIQRTQGDYDVVMKMPNGDSNNITLSARAGYAIYIKTLAKAELPRKEA